MGVQTSSNQNNNFPLTLQLSPRVQADYLNKVFLQNKKSTDKFKQQLYSIIKRSSYLKYAWAQQLITFLNQTNKQELYKKYKSALKQNCIRQGRKQKTFCPQKIRRIFIESIKQRYPSNMNTTLTLAQLTSVYDECKAYMMVATWLHELVTLQNNSTNQKDCMEKKELHSFQEQQTIYQILTRLSYLTYVKHLGTSSPFSVQNNPNLKISPLSSQFLAVLQLLKKNLSFSKRQRVIQQLQFLLEKESGSQLEQKIEQIRLYLGQPQIFTHLLFTRELGNINVDFLWKKFCESDLKLFLQ